MSARKLAILNNEKKYHTGRQCKHGHFSKRYTKSSACIECVKLGSNGKSLNSGPKMLAFKQLTSRSFTLYPNDFVALRDIAITQILSKHNALTRFDVIEHIIATPAFNAKFHYRMPIVPECAKSLLATADLLNRLTGG